MQQLNLLLLLIYITLNLYIFLIFLTSLNPLLKFFPSIFRVHYTLINIKHYQYTNSNVAKKILDDFGNEVAHFKKVVPHDYKRMMSLISSFEQQGFTNEQAKVEAFNAFKKKM